MKQKTNISAKSAILEYRKLQKRSTKQRHEAASKHHLQHLQSKEIKTEGKAFWRKAQRYKGEGPDTHYHPEISQTLWRAIPNEEEKAEQKANSNSDYFG